MSKILPYPTLHVGLTPADIPYGYSMYRTPFDDHSGYRPCVVGSETGEDGVLVIIVALSPGVYQRCTMALAGQSVEQTCELVERAFVALATPDALTCIAPQTGSARAPDVGAHNREVQ